MNRLAVADWDAKAYDRISDPQVEWGVRVLERLPLRGNETVVDEGCGAGRLTEMLVAHLPRGHVVALDASENMLRVARDRLARHGSQVTFVRADAARWIAPARVDAVFSTATYHWVRDHDVLFESIAASLRPGGRLVAQCGAAGNLARIRSCTAELRARPEYASHFRAFHEPWTYATPEQTQDRLVRSGFEKIRVWTEPAPVRFDSLQAFREFVEKVVLRDELARLPGEGARTRYLDDVVEAALQFQSPLTLDYVRLNIDARR